MIEGVSAKKKIATGKPLVKGYNFSKSGHVLKVLARHEDNKVYLRSQVLPSMKKSTVYACCFCFVIYGNSVAGSLWLSSRSRWPLQSCSCNFIFTCRVLCGA